MKTRIVLICALLAAAPVFAQDWDDDAPPPPPDEYAQDYAPPDQGPSLDDFRNDSELSWNGEWVNTPEYGTVWRPTRVSDDWQPYMYGRWAWTNAGWAWVSDEPFGWAVYHYGRWAWSPMGWLWVPGRVWAPAWVAWHWGDGYAGWCPLGPRHYVYQQPQQWVYVGERHFLEPIRRNAIPRQDRPAPRAIGGGAPAPRIVERATGRTVKPLAVADAPTPHAAVSTSGNVFFYRPKTAPVPRQGQAGPRPQPQPQQGPHAAQPQRPIYFGGVPAPKQGGQPRPQQQGPSAKPAPAPAGTPAPAPAAEKRPSKSEQTVPHAKER